MRISAIYPTYQGENNIKGIGAPVIFVRAAGCHLRCYVKTLGVLCDTPEALEKDSGSDMSTSEIVQEVERISKSSGGINLICFSGGDPMWRNPESIHELFRELGAYGYKISVETSGTIDVTPFVDYEHVSWVVDYKLKSAGISQKFKVGILPRLTHEDIIKFVVYDETDYQEFYELFEGLYQTTKAVISIGCYWGSNEKLKYADLVRFLIADGLLGKVHINMQAHKLLSLYDATDKSQFSDLKIPVKI